MSSSLNPHDAIAEETGPLSRHGLLKFIIPSVLGILLFLVPYSVGDTINIGMGLAADWPRELLSDVLPAIVTLVLVTSVALTLYVKAVKPGRAQESAWGQLFDVAPLWTVMRGLGAIFALMTFFQVGPEFVTAAFTGGVMLNDLAPVLLTFFFFAAILLPLLVDFGFMEFIGSLLRKPFRDRLPAANSAGLHVRNRGLAAEVEDTFQTLGDFCDIPDSNRYYPVDNRRYGSLAGRLRDNIG